MEEEVNSRIVEASSAFDNVKAVFVIVNVRESVFNQIRNKAVFVMVFSCASCPSPPLDNI